MDGTTETAASSSSDEGNDDSRRVMRDDEERQSIKMEDGVGSGCGAERYGESKSEPRTGDQQKLAACLPPFLCCAAVRCALLLCVESSAFWALVLC